MLPASRFERLDLAAIDFPDLFPRFLLEAEEHIPQPTVERFGLLRPLPVVEAGCHRFQLLGDYHQFQSARQAGLAVVTCQIFPDSIPAELLLSLQVLFSQQAGQMSPVLQAWIALRAQTLVGDQEQMALLALMGIKPQAYKRDELIALLHLEPSAVIALHRGLLTQKSGKRLAVFAPEDQRLVVRVINAYRLGGSKQQKLLEMVGELVMRENRSVADQLVAWLPDEGETNNLPQRAQHLLDHLHGLCFAEKEAAEKAFQGFVRSLQPPEEITIDHSLSFEDESVEVRIRFADAEALRHHWQTLRSLVS